MTITHHPDLIQGSDEWHAARCGLITASEAKLILTPTLKVADNEKTRQHVWELAAQRISRYVEPNYIGDDMLRGMEDEIRARAKYEENHGVTVDEVGFITNDEWGFTLGYSPDGQVRGTKGGIECKSRRQKYQVQTVVEWHRDKTVPVDYVLQVQTGLLVSGWDWIDLVSYSGGLHMATMRVHPDAAVAEAIINAAGETEKRIAAAVADYHEAAKALPITERVIQEEMYV